MGAAGFTDFAPLLAAVALIWKIVDFAKHVRVRDADSIVTQMATWIAGVLVVWLLAQTDFASSILIGHTPLAHLNLASQILLGLSGGSSASVAYDYKRAFDRSDSAAQPSLVTGRIPITPPPTIDSDRHIALTGAQVGESALGGSNLEHEVQDTPRDASADE